MHYSDLPSTHAGAWSYLDIGKLAAHVPFQPSADFVRFMQSQPFIVINFGTRSEREDLAIAILKRTFSFNIRGYGASRARYANAYRDLTMTRGVDGPVVLDELCDYKTLLLTEVDGIDSKDYNAFNTILWTRRSKGGYTIMTMRGLPEFNDSINEAFKNYSTVISL
jgi:hypothetical protein